MFWSRLTQISSPPPTAELESVLPLAICKLQCRVDFDEHDVLIEGYRAAAFARLGGPERLGVALTPQQWRLTLAGFPACIEIPFAPVTAINAVKYFDTADAEQTMPAADYRASVLLEPAVIEPVTSWPAVAARADAVQIEFSVGYAVGALPSDLRQAAQLLVGHWYRETEAGSVVEQFEIPEGVQQLIVAHRRGWVA